jgi:hypothetical protein
MRCLLRPRSDRRSDAGFSGLNILLSLALGMLGLLSSSVDETLAAGDDQPPCRGAYFQSPFDHQINASLLVKRGEACTIKIRIPDVKDITVSRPPKRGKAEPVAENAVVIYTPNNTTGRDRFSLTSIRQQGEKPEIKQTVLIEVEILAQADYPYNFLMAKPPPPPPAPEGADDKKPEDKKPPAK